MLADITLLKLVSISEMDRPQNWLSSACRTELHYAKDHGLERVAAGTLTGGAKSPRSILLFMLLKATFSLFAVQLEANKCQRHRRYAALGNSLLCAWSWA